MNDYIRQTSDKIKQFSNLQSGWHYGEGIAPKPEIIDLALLLNRQARMACFTETDAFPGVYGEIQVTAYHKSIYFEFTIEPDKKITFVYERDNSTIIYEEGLSLVQVLAKLDFWGVKWISSESSIQNTMTPGRIASKASPFAIPVMEAESRLSTENVLSVTPVEYASILSAFTESFQGPPQYSGGYRRQLSRTFAHT